jgi:ribosome biogenesis GTP-binding protein YsxC/EngB
MLVLRRLYHSKRMRTHQSTIARLDNVFKPIESMFEDPPDIYTGSGNYAQKRAEEKLMKPMSYIMKYIEESELGYPRTARKFRDMVNKKRLAFSFLDQLKPKVKHVASAVEESQLPLATLPEIAVIGRSNVGKSSLINAIVGTRKCAVVNRPGSTQEVHFYHIGDPSLICFVDVPGFGFAYADANQRRQWTEFSLWYLRSRKNLRCVLLVIDARHGFADADSELISFLKKHKIDFKIVMNKCDLVETKILAKRLSLLAQDLSVPDAQILNRVIPVSALRDKGIAKLRRLCESFKLNRDVVIAGQLRKVQDLLEERRLKKAQLREDRRERKKESVAEIWGTVEEPPAKGRKSRTNGKPENESEVVSCFEAEPDAYRSEALSILKQPLPLSGEKQDITLLEQSDFVSQDEKENLGKRGKLPAPNGESTDYETQMKLGHELNWKMRLELEHESLVEELPKPLLPPVRSAHEEDMSALGFISTFNPGTIPRGIKKWKVIGMKPRIKTSRAKAQNTRPFIQ